MKQVIRIIGGQYRGKKLPVPDVEGLRPTPDRIRETLFNWLMNDILDARCLDAYAGTGALGLEAFSRGASKVTFIEYSPIAHANLSRIITHFGTPKLNLIKADTQHYLQNTTEQFDLIFLDPPFAQNLIPQCLNELAQNSCLKTGGLVYLESANEIEIDEGQWEKLKLKQAGSVVYGLFKKL